MDKCDDTSFLPAKFPGIGPSRKCIVVIKDQKKNTAESSRINNFHSGH